MMRWAAMAVGVVTVATTVVAQTDVIAERKGIMRGNGAATRVGTQMIRGEVPFDPAKATEGFTGSGGGGRRGPLAGGGAGTRVGTRMIRGGVPFDLAKAKEVFTGIAAGMDRFPNLFP